MPARRLTAGLVALTVTWATTVGARQDAAQPDRPRETGLVERTETRLTQIDVTVTGPPEIVADLRAEDFSLRINFKRIRKFGVDRICEMPTPGEETTETRGPPVNYLLYFDQPHLTLAGRQRAIELATRLLPRLLSSGGQAMIVSSARRTEVLQEFSPDLNLLTQALRRLEGDRTQWDTFAEQEELRVAEVVRTLDRIGVQQAASLARVYQREEVVRADKDIRRIMLALSWMVDLPAPKAVLLFSDTFRERPGEHYMTFFGTSLRRPIAAGELTMDNLKGQPAFDLLVNAAAAQGIRFYPVLAQGVVTAAEVNLPSGDTINRTGAFSNSTRTRQLATQISLGNLAAETGGHAFVNGEMPGRIIGRIHEDFACIYLLSFEPEGLSNDAPLRVVLSSSRRGVRVHSRGRVVVQSESTKLAARLLAAFASRGSEGDVGSGLQTILIPTGFRDGAFTALLQVSVPGTALTTASWDLGASLVSGDRVRAQASGRLELRRQGIPVVLEREVELEPGSWEIVAVAHERTSDFVLSEHVLVEWPDPEGAPATCGPLALVQPISGAFLRDGATRDSGSLARAESDPVRPNLPTAAMGLVCRARRGKAEVTVERTLVGASKIDFAPILLELDEEPCAQVRDLIPAGVLGPGAYRYEMRARAGDAILDVAARDFFVE